MNQEQYFRVLYQDVRVCSHYAYNESQKGFDETKLDIVSHYSELIHFSHM